MQPLSYTNHAADTIEKNITFGSSRIKRSDLIQAADAAALMDTINSFPHGFETIVGEKGIVLSGGQKQRIALARALLHPTPVLILDDPISQVDMETGADIIRNIRAMAGKRSIIIVSHRLSALGFADTIISMVDGRIVESGTHSDLMRSDGYYAATFRLQEIEEELNAL